jgi:hypothetical protein
MLYWRIALTEDAFSWFATATSSVETRPEIVVLKLGNVGEATTPGVTPKLDSKAVVREDS